MFMVISGPLDKKYCANLGKHKVLSVSVKSLSLNIHSFYVGSYFTYAHATLIDTQGPTSIRTSSIAKNIRSRTALM